MKYYHEQDLKKEEPLTPRWVKGVYINGDFIKIIDMDGYVLEIMGNELDDGWLKTVWFLTVDNDPYAAPYGPCEYDRERDVYVNCDGFEIRNEYYEDYEEN